MKIRIGTRASKLALAQTEEFIRALRRLYPDIDAEIIKIRTTGDKLLNANLAKIGGKGLFIKEIEEALLADEIDAAVHSMKDMPAAMHENLDIVALLQRGDARDAFVSGLYSSVEQMPAGAVVGTSSIRRQVQILRLRPDLKIVPFRGNVPTRLRKVWDGQVDGTILAVAGLRRLAMDEFIRLIFPTNVLLPAVGQGIIGIQCRSDNTQVISIISPLDHKQTRIALEAERSFLSRLDGDCTTPIAAFARLKGDKVRADFMLACGDKTYFTKRVGTMQNAREMGFDAADELAKLCE
ncbi:porphobilinogen deaminase [Rickettsiales bacterium]|nr:porphobilinogen deaminase [Rickettsiales bacterium]